MATVEAIPEGAEGSVLEATQQDFLQEAKSLIAQHYKRINENKPQVTSINVFKNKHQKPKTGRFIPFEIKKSEILDIVQEHRMVLRSINYPKDTSKCPPSEEDSEQISSSKPHVLNLKEKYQPEDPLQKEQVKLGKIITDIESVSKKMEKEKQLRLKKPRMLESFHSHVGLNLQNLTSSLGHLRGPAEKMLYDWRSFAWRRSSHPPHESTQSLAGSSGIFKDYYMKSYKKKELPTKPDQKPSKRAKAVPKSDKLDSKVKRIGPHIEIYQLFQERNKLIFTKRIVKLITITQAFIRGWLERKRLQRLKTKALYHGPNLKAVIMMYQFLIYRIRHRLGLWRTRQVINFGELEEWMDRKKFYETMFAKREDWQGLERSELMKYFNDCGHFPTQSQIDEYWDLFHRHSQGKYSEVIKKSNAIELLFTLYPPLGAKVNIGTRLRSTWLRPIVDGEEGYKYIVSGHPILKRANIQTAGRLVANSIRERKMRQFYKS
ncbi:IQ domain-containing protein M isoform X1 [Peromyscus maniculatus bairdii]|uniref:IQ motif containing M n=1 Tax=Peromyscus maniculatus bairdii TaxID=230844 RepID=A0A8C8TZ48_PERMB|nr:IQ domain-containing protein M [Peromyscus maniculatus bairdii]